MRESIEAAAQYIKAKYEELGISADWRQNYDVAVLATFMGIPKEGPSAGITIAVGITSGDRSFSRQMNMEPSAMLKTVFPAVWRQSGNARLLDDLEAVCLPRPVHPVAFLAGVHHFSQGEFEPLKIDLPTFRKDLREKFF